MNKSKHFPWKLSVFTVIQLVLFIQAVYLIDTSLWVSFVLLMFSAICMSFSIHIFFHECVHHSNNYPPLWNYISSLLIGLPFDGYRIHHYNHHHYENKSGDFSTTWIYDHDDRIPNNVWAYTFGWYRQLLVSINHNQPFPGSTELITKIRKRVYKQKIFLVFVLIALSLSNWKILSAYLLLIYFGWFFTALHNYGQHPPLEDEQIRTFSNPLYNRLFFNNGLHWEHHKLPALRWHELKLDTQSQRINFAHLLSPLLRTGVDYGK